MYFDIIIENFFNIKCFFFCFFFRNQSLSPIRSHPKIFIHHMSHNLIRVIVSTSHIPTVTNIIHRTNKNLIRVIGSTSRATVTKRTIMWGTKVGTIRQLPSGMNNITIKVLIAGITICSFRIMSKIDGIISGN